MKNERYPKIAYNGYVHGTRKRGRQKKRWIDMIREDCKELHLTLQEATCRTQDRRVWRATIDERLTRAIAITLSFHGIIIPDIFSSYVIGENEAWFAFG